MLERRGAFLSGRLSARRGVGIEDMSIGREDSLHLWIGFVCTASLCSCFREQSLLMVVPVPDPLQGPIRWSRLKSIPHWYLAPSSAFILTRYSGFMPRSDSPESTLSPEQQEYELPLLSGHGDKDEREDAFYQTPQKKNLSSSGTLKFIFAAFGVVILVLLGVIVTLAVSRGTVPDPSAPVDLDSEDAFSPARYVKGPPTGSFRGMGKEIQAVTLSLKLTLNSKIICWPTASMSPLGIMQE